MPTTLTQPGIESAICKLALDEQLAVVLAGLEVARPSEQRPLAARLIELAQDPPEPSRWPWSRRQHLLRTSVAMQARAGMVAHWMQLNEDQRKIGLTLCRGRWAEALAMLDEATIIAHGLSIAQCLLDTCDPAFVDLLPIVLDQSSPQAVQLASVALLATAMRLVGQVDPQVLNIPPDHPATTPILDPIAPTWQVEDDESLLDAIARAVATYDNHRRKEVLLAAIVLLESPAALSNSRSGLLQLITDPAMADPSAQHTLARAIARAKAPIARQRALAWIGFPSLALSCAERFARAPSLLDHRLVLPKIHLALSPSRARHLGLVSIATRPVRPSALPPGVEPGLGSLGRHVHEHGPVPRRSMLAKLPVQARRQLPRLITMLQADRTAARLALDPLLIDPDPLTRLAACCLAQGGDLRDFCFDANASVAIHAAHRVSSVGIAESDRLRAHDASRTRFASLLCRSPHAGVRLIGQQESDRLSPGLGSSQSILAAHRLYRSDPSGFADWIRDVIRTQRVAQSVSVLMLAGRIGALDAIAPLLLTIVRQSLSQEHTNDPRLCATAITALGKLARQQQRQSQRQPDVSSLSSQAIQSVLIECLGRHSDARVRANATESLGRLSPSRSRDAQLLTASTDNHHRVQAAALRWLLAPSDESAPWATSLPHRQQATDTLHAMLMEDKPDHRLASVWVIQRTLATCLNDIDTSSPSSSSGSALVDHSKTRRHSGYGDLLQVVRWLAREDPHAPIRSRAKAIVRRVDRDPIHA